MNAIKQNAKEDQLEGLKQIYQEFIDGSGSSDLQQLSFSSGSELRCKLEQPFDFAKANSGNKMMKNIAGKGGAKKVDDDFDDGFNEPVKAAKGQQIKVSEDNAFAVTHLDWSCNAQQLAVSYGKTNHTSWCEHQSIVSIWRNVSKTDQGQNLPLHNIDVPNCVTCLAFHPTEPQILAGGTINGEIYIWSLEQDQAADRKVIKSDADEYRHREPIQSLMWTKNDNQVNLISISSDGKILLWHKPLKDLRYPLKGNVFAKQDERHIFMLNCQAMA